MSKEKTTLFSSTKVLILRFKRASHNLKCDIDFDFQFNINDMDISNNNVEARRNNYYLKSIVSLYQFRNCSKYFSDVYINDNWYRFCDINDSVMNIPSEIDGKTVTSIGSNILMHGDTAKNVLEIVIPETVTAIADNAFSLCQTLEKVTIPDSVTEIGKDVFTDYGNVRIYCSTDSAAHKYAQDNNIGFILTDGGYEPVKLGDVDGDGKISAKDSMTIQRYAINLKKLEPNQIRAADADGDGRVTNKDAIILLRYTINIPVKFAIGEMV